MLEMWSIPTGLNGLCKVSGLSFSFRCKILPLSWSRRSIICIPTESCTVTWNPKTSFLGKEEWSSSVTLGRYVKNWSPQPISGLITERSQLLSYFFPGKVCPCNEYSHHGADIYKRHSTVYGAWASGRETLWPHSWPLVSGMHSVWAVCGDTTLLHQQHLPVGELDHQGPHQVAKKHEPQLQGNCT